ncbi:methyl-accepting chemotaxis protein [Pseudomonas sp. J452]|uniref:methyl-accepting chemotaxis protein n=1 Tax=Pseudomonas sp. J452 TaxID=2898441 RepID=UPI00391843CC
MQQMTATVQEVARHAETASDSAQQADQRARQGDGVIGQTIAHIESLTQEVRQSAEAIGQLQAETQNIGGVLDVIKAVAEQTNLLALNAAIEAARAGEQGRGFAVVADEVRALAVRTQSSTAEIEQLIGRLQSGAEQAVQLMDKSSNLAEQSRKDVHQAGQALRAITDAVSNIQQLNQQIATAAEQQSAVAMDISRSVTSIRDVAEQSASASEETAASSIDLARLGGELQVLVGQFRIA